MARLQKLKLVESNNQEITSEARRLLHRLSVKVESLPPDPVFEKRFDMPFVETEDGRRYFGIKGITWFVEQGPERK